MLPLYPRLVDTSPTEVPQLQMENYLSIFAELGQGVTSGLEFQAHGSFQQGAASTKCLDLNPSILKNALICHFRFKRL